MFNNVWHYLPYEDLEERKLVDKNVSVAKTKLRKNEDVFTNMKLMSEHCRINLHPLF